LEVQLAVRAQVSSESRRGGRLQFRSDVEGLRGVAVLLVVAFHARVSAFSGGFVGVDAFFVISGYLITALLTEEIERTGSLSLVAFFARRIRRLIPAAAVVLLATVLLSAIVLPPLEVIRAATATQAAAAYMSNVHFLRLASDYFSGESASSPIVHTWSLSVEEQFYLMWPLVFLGLARAMRGRTLCRRHLAWLLTAIGVMSFAAASFYTTANHWLAFYSMPLRAWEFACGGLASMIGWRAASEEIGSGRRLLNVVMGWAGLGLLLSAGAIYSASTEFPGVAAAWPVTGAAMILVAGAMPMRAKWSVGTALSAAPMQWIGRHSYSWYLWHWPVLALGTSLLPAAGVLGRVAFAAFALLLAALTYKFVEAPARAAARAGGVEPRREWRTVRLGLAAALVVICAAEITRREAMAASQGPAQRAFTRAATDVADPYRDGCVNGQDDARVHICTYGMPEARTTIALFGDSHAVQWFPAVDAIARQHQWRLLVIAKTRCATAVVPVYTPSTGVESALCRRWRAATMDSLRLRHPAVVVLSNALLYIRGPRLSSKVPAVTSDVWTAGMIATLHAFKASRIPTIVIQDTPLLAANVPICLARSGWFGHRTNSCATDRLIAINAEVAIAEQHAIDAVPGNHLIDLTDAICSPTICAPIVRGIIAYSDNEHLSASMARSLAPVLGRAFDELKIETPVSGGMAGGR
jgi:peptidoglycan/LPS O-acetylase OafA/YrhL